MNSPIQDFLKALDHEEKKQKEILAKDNMGILFRAAINEFDWYHYNFINQVEPTQEQTEQYYICRLGMTRAIRLSFESVERYDVPVVTFRRRKDITLAALELVSAIGMIEHGRRVAHSTKTGLCSIKQIDNYTFEFELPPVLVDEDYHERSMVAHYANESRRIFKEALHDVLSEELETDIEEKLHELVFVFRDDFIGYGAHPLLDDYFLGLAYSEIQLQEGFDTFHYATEFGGIPFQKYILASIFLISLSMKHRRFCEALIKKAPHIRMENILTISSEWNDFVPNIAQVLNEYGLGFEGYTTTSIEDAEKIAGVLSLSRENIGMLERPISPLPYLIKSSETGMIKLLSGAHTDTMQFLLHSLRHHFPREYDKNQQQREGSFRRAVEKELRRSFRNVDFRNNIKIRKDGRIVTDIDLVVLDPSTGSIILCQLKYQDLFGSDIISASSRHSRLKKETEHWLNAVEQWQRHVGEKGIRSAFHLRRDFEIRNVYRLVLSKHFAHPLKDVRATEDFTYSNWIQLFNALALMKKSQGSFRTIGGLISILNKQNSEAPLVEHVHEPPTQYSLGPLSFTVQMASA